MNKSSSAINNPRIRCAIYVRKSTEENLNTDFNSLDAQREACEAYVQSRKHDGWTVIPTDYSDAGWTGANIERPALQRLLVDIQRGRVDMVLVYKLDRLSRSLLDFAKLVEMFEAHGVAFTAITQNFATDTAIGKLTLHMLLSFAQFEREIIGERIRDKVAAAKRRGKFTGGTPPLGYNVDAEKTRLILNPEEAKLVQYIFKRFTETGSPLTIADELNKKGITTKAWMTKHGVFREGKNWHRMHLYRVLNNRTYLGEVIHKDKTYPGEHEAIITKDLWDRAHAARENNTRHRSQQIQSKAPALLKGLIRCGACDKAMSPVSTGGPQKSYKYYTCGRASKAGHSACPVRSVPAGDIETAVIEQLRAIFKAPEVVAQTYCATQTLEIEELASLRSERVELEAHLVELKQIASSDQTSADAIDTQLRLQDINDDILQIQARLVTEHDVAECLRRLDPIWDDLFPAEQSRIVQLLVERITVNPEGMDIRIRSHGLHSLVSEIRDTADRHERSSATRCKAKTRG